MKSAAIVDGQVAQDGAKFADVVRQLAVILGPAIRQEIAGLTGAALDAKKAELQAMWNAAIAERDAERAAVDGMPDTGETP